MTSFSPRLIPVLLAALLAVGCGGRKAGPAPTVVATVNGSQIASQQLRSALPSGIDSTVDLDSLRRGLLDGLVNYELMVQEAERRGLESDIKVRLEMEMKGLVTQELYNEVVAPGGELTEPELRKAYELLKTEHHIKVIEVRSETLARQLRSELAQGTQFESLATRHSVRKDARVGGDQGFMPELTVLEPMRTAVQALAPGEYTDPVKTLDGYQIILLVARRPADPPPPPLDYIREQLTGTLRLQRRRTRAREHMADLRSRLEYNEAGLDILCKSVDEITGEEREVCVAVKDNTRYVKVGNLLHLAARFPPGLDTTLKKYALRRELEDDLLYEEALERGLAEVPHIAEELAQTRRRLLRNALYEREVEDRAEVADDAVRAYFEENRGNFPGGDFGAVKELIRRRLKEQLKDELMSNLLVRLRAGADIAIDEDALRSVVPTE